MVTLLIRKLKLQRVLVFTHSTESVHRFKIETMTSSSNYWCFSSGLRLALLLANLGHATGELHSLVKRRRKVGCRKHLVHLAILQRVNTLPARCWTNLRLVIFSWLFAAMHLLEELMSTISMEWSPMMLPLIWKRETRKSDLYWVTFFPRYVHRVGRTARAGKIGTAVTLSEEKQVWYILFETSFSSTFLLPRWKTSWKWHEKEGWTAWQKRKY